MKIAITADWHLGLGDAMAQLDEMIAKSRGCEVLCVVGDIFDTPSIGDARTTGATAKVAIEAVAAYPRSLLLVGNHDSAGAGSPDALHVFDGMPNVAVVRSPRTFGAIIPGCRVMCIPWSWQEPAAGQIPFGVDCELFLGHLRVHGALLTAKMPYEARGSDFAISCGLLSELPAKRIALGDFHRRQDLTGRGGYVGALRQLRFSDEGNPQGFEILDLDTWTVEWIELSQCPYHRTVEINPGESTPQQGANERLRVRYLSMPDPDEVRQLESTGIVVQHITEREERVARAAIPPGVMQDRRELIRLWAANQSPPVAGNRLDQMLRTYEDL